MHRSILMLEDDSDDRYLTQETLQELEIDIPVTYLNSSAALFELLACGERPSLILIDYNSTPENGLQILRKLKADEAWSGIPVVILSDSDLASYRDACYRMGASSYIKKPDSVFETRAKIGTFFRYWFEVAEVG